MGGVARRRTVGVVIGGGVLRDVFRGIDAPGTEVVVRGNRERQQQQ